MVLGYLPHCHLQDRAARYELIDAAGDSEILLEIPRRDFN